MAHQFDYTQHLAEILPLLKALEKKLPLSKDDLQRIKKKYSKKEGGLFSKTDLITAYRALAGKHGLAPFNNNFIKHLQMKPIRTISGVAPVTVLTKPYPCPGDCLFCPSDVRMPKSYLSDEPGAQRAERNYFDPYLQVYRRLESLQAMGHVTDKVELIILGGTWDYYPLAYQIWFIKDCFRAMNDFAKNNDCQKIEQLYQQFQDKLKAKGYIARGADPLENIAKLKAYQFKEGKSQNKNLRFNQIMQQLYLEPEKIVGIDIYQQASWQDLAAQQENNEIAAHRCVGLVLETRPDRVNQQRVKQWRRLGATKIQLGVQSLDNQVLKKNQRGHSVAETKQAFSLLRQAGFKIHVHWMANLYGSDPKQDQEDYLKLFSDDNFKPDEIKIYPCSLLESAPLMKYYQQGKWQPYSHSQLLEVVSFALLNTPEYCRITRVVRDIPSPDIVVGNKKTNFRQIAQQHLEKIDRSSVNIRAREIRKQKFDLDKVYLDKVSYQTTVSEEIFLQFVVGPEKRILAFLRLSLPKQETNFIPELTGKAIIREIHVYGVALAIGQEDKNKAQHLGFGKKLINQAKKIAQQAGFSSLAVISAIGTKDYYRQRGFTKGQLYQSMTLANSQDILNLA